MTAITFPTDPANGELYTAPNGCVYIWDGEKWVVNSTIYTGQELANISQDRVAPMFVNGVNTGITFAYNETTNTLTSTVTGGSADTGDWAFSGNAAYNGNDYDQGLYIAPGGEGVSYIFVPGNSQSADSALQLSNGAATGQVNVTAYNKQWQFDSNGDLTLPAGGDILDSTGTSVLGSAAGTTQPYLELTNITFITQAATLGTPVTITAAPWSASARLSLTITEGPTLDIETITITTAGTGHVVGQRYRIEYWQIGGSNDASSIDFEVATVGEDGELLGIADAAFVGSATNIPGTYTDLGLLYQPSVFDDIDTGLVLTRGRNQGIFNIAEEAEYDNSDYLSPLGTEWNSDGWGDLSQLGTRTYTTWREALDGNAGENIIGAELVMHDTINDKYYKFEFTEWGGSDGGFAYTRTLITDPNYFRKLDGGEEVDVIVEHPNLSQLEETYLEAEAMWVDARDADAANIAPDTRPWDGMSSIDAYPVLMEAGVQTPPAPSNFPPLLNSANNAYTAWQEALAASVGITRGNNQGIYNPYTENGWDDEVSPAGTLWNIDGWDDLTDLTDRTYTTLDAAFGGNGLGLKIVGTECVMSVPSIDKYYAVKFLSWTQNNSGGGFSYTRKEIDVTKLNQGVRFADGTVQTTAYIPVDTTVISTAPNDRRIETASGYKAVSVTAESRGETLNATIRGTSNNWDFNVNATETLNILYDQEVSTYSFLEFSFDNEATWVKVRFGGGSFEQYYQMVFEDGIHRSVTDGDTVRYRVVSGGESVVWWDKEELPRGGSNFRGAIIDYHAYTSHGTIIGTIHIIDDDGDEYITHTEVSSADSNDSMYDNLWIVTSEGEIRYARVDGSAKTLKIHWTAKVFYGSDYSDD